jgi:hypothetical protein
MMKKIIVLLAVSALVLAMAPAAQADTVVFNDSGQLNLTGSGRTVLAAVNFYDPGRISNGQRTVGTIQGVDFDDFDSRNQDTGSPITLLAGAAGSTLSTVIPSSDGREFGSDPAALAFSGPENTAAENHAMGGAY